MTVPDADRPASGDAVTVLVDYRYFCLQPGEALPFPSGQQAQSLAQVASSGPSLIVFTGLRSGPVGVSVTSGPPFGPASDWTLREQLEMQVREPLYATSPDMPNTHLFEPLFTPAVPGPYTVDVLARNRVEGSDVMAELDTDPVEQYLILFTPAR